MGLCGEETTAASNLVWITKTHWPLDSINKGVFRAKKMIKIVRNPLDTIVSHVQGMWTMASSLTPNEQLHQEMPYEWATTVDMFINGMADDFAIVI